MSPDCVVGEAGARGVMVAGPECLSFTRLLLGDDGSAKLLRFVENAP